MANNTDHQPDVSALLKSLTAYLPKGGAGTAYQGQGQQQYQQYQQQQHYGYQTQSANAQQPDQYYWQPPHQPVQQQHYHATPLERFHNTAVPTGQNTSTPAKASFDARTIKTWPVALRHVTKLSATNPEFIPHIRAMIANQHDNERQWWAGRKALQDQQAARVGGVKDLDDVLTSIGVRSEPKAGSEDDEAELKRFDVKVHKAQVTMIEAMTMELRKLGVPFFGLTDEDEQKRVQELQKKMIAFLEELCQE